MREVCGLLLGSHAVEAVIPTRNVSGTPETHFEIDPQPLFAAIRAERGGGAKLLGYYHSHPTGLTTPSAHDRAQATNDGRLWIIVAGGQMTVWQMNDRRLFEPIPIQLTYECDETLCDAAKCVPDIT